MKSVQTAVALVCLLNAMTAHAQTSAPTTSPSVEVQLGLAAAADGTAVYPMQVIPPGLQEVTACMRFAKGSSFKKVHSAWIAVEVDNPQVPANYEIAKADLSVEKSPTAEFKYSQAKPMVPGKYRVELSSEGQPIASVDFSAAAGAAPKVSVKAPADLIPLTNGRVWTYDFVQESGGGAKISMPDVQPDAEGKLRATVTLTVSAEDAAGTHTELRRNDKLVFEEWLKLDRQGLLSAQRKAADEISVLDPPQLIWPMPSHGTKKWNYKPKDKSYEQTCRMWGPLPIKTPQGEQPGYVVLVQQPMGLGSMTAERHFVPGVGMVREIIVTAMNGTMVSRQSMELKSVK